MTARIKKQHHGQFNPAFITVIDGKVTKVTLKEAEENADKYALTPIGHLYEDSENLIKQVKKRQKKVVAEIVDMNKVRRGTSFDPNNNPKKAAILAFKQKQEVGLMKIAKRKNLPFQEAIVLDKSAILAAKEAKAKEEAKQKKAKELEDKKAK